MHFFYNCIYICSALLLKHNKFYIILTFIYFSDKMKEATVAKIAYQCSDLYADAMKLMQLQSLKDLWPKVSILLNSCY